MHASTLEEQIQHEKKEARKGLQMIEKVKPPYGDIPKEWIEARKQAARNDVEKASKAERLYKEFKRDKGKTIWCVHQRWVHAPEKNPYALAYFVCPQVAQQFCAHQQEMEQAVGHHDLTYTVDEIPLKDADYILFANIHTSSESSNL